MRLLVFIILLFQFKAECQEHSALFMLGGKYNQGFEDFNSDLSNNSIQQLNSSAFGLQAHYLISYKRWQATTGIAANFFNNGKSNTSINLSEYTFRIQSGFNLFKPGKKNALYLHFGVGTSLYELYIDSPDSNLTISGVLGGNENLFYSQGFPNFQVNSQLSWHYQPITPSNKLFFTTRLGYDWSITNTKWRDNFIPLNQISGIYLKVGIGFILGEVRHHS